LSWNTHKLGELIETKKGYAFKSSWYQNYGHPIVKVSDFTDDSIDTSSLANIPQEIADEYSSYKLCERDVIIQTVGSWPSNPASVVGKCINVPLAAHGALLNQNAVKISPKDRLDNIFLYYLLRSPAFKNYIINTARGSASQASITLDAIRKFEITIPSAESQKHIGFVLKCYDDLIENNRRRIQLLEESARLLYKEWFVQLRFPGHEHVKIVDGVPEGWGKTTAYEVMDVLSGGTPKTKVAEYWDGEIPFFTPKDTTDNAFCYSTKKMITELGLSKCNSRLYAKNTLFITARGTVGKLSLAQREMAMNQSCYALVGQGEINQFFLYCSLKAAIDQFKARASGAVFDAIVVDTFKLIPFLKPTPLLIEQFTEFVTDVFDQVDKLSSMNRRLSEARDLLLPRLMNGTLTV